MRSVRVLATRDDGRFDALTPVQGYSRWPRRLSFGLFLTPQTSDEALRPHNQQHGETDTQHWEHVGLRRRYYIK